MLKTIYAGQFILFLAIAIGISMLNGCIVLPIPTPEHGGAGVLPENEEALNKILKIGQTTRADILLQWGPPSKVMDNEKIMIYDWKRVRGYVLWAIGGQGAGYADAIPWTAAHYLCLEFDSRNRLNEYKLFQRQHLNPWDDANSHLLEWIKSRQH